MSQSHSQWLGDYCKRNRFSLSQCNKVKARTYIYTLNSACTTRKPVQSSRYSQTTCRVDWTAWLCWRPLITGSCPFWLSLLCGGHPPRGRVCDRHWLPPTCATLCQSSLPHSWRPGSALSQSRFLAGRARCTHWAHYTHTKERSFTQSVVFGRPTRCHAGSHRHGANHRYSKTSFFLSLWVSLFSLTLLHFIK